MMEIRRLTETGGASPGGLSTPPRWVPSARPDDSNFAKVLAKASRKPPAAPQAPASAPAFGQRSLLLQSSALKLGPAFRPREAGVSTTTLERIPFADLLIPTARRHGVNPELVAAVVKAESAFNPLAQSRAGAKGLMQLMDGTARSLGLSNVFDPGQNLDGGTKFLSSLLRRYNGNTKLALAAYNAGPGAVEKYGGIPPYKETRDYVSKVLDYWRLFGGDSNPLIRLGEH